MGVRGEVSCEEVQGAFVVLGDFLVSNQREVCGGDNVGSRGHDQVMIGVDS
jgi:hypothetical protein